MPHVKQRFTPLTRCVALALPLALMAAIFVISSIPHHPLEAVRNPFALIPPALNNLLHIPAFALLTFLWFGAVAALGGRRPLRFLLPPLIAFGFGVFDEWHQLSVPGRFGSLTDVLLNAVGIGCALPLCRWFEERLWRPRQGFTNGPGCGKSS